MPAAQPTGTALGLQTIYCDYNENGQEDDQLHCPEWVTAGLVDFAEEQGL